jgi:hypothetical protein
LVAAVVEVVQAELLEVAAAEEYTWAMLNHQLHTQSGQVVHLIMLVLQQSSVIYSLAVEALEHNIRLL